MEIREPRPEEYTAAGELVAEVYDAIAPLGLGEYADELRDVAGRSATAVVLVAVEDGGTLLGSVTYVPGPDSSGAEFTEADACGIRMLAVAPDAQGRGVGKALVEACIARALAAGKRQMVLHTTDWMTVAHKLYPRLGFERDTGMDWLVPEPEGPFWLRGYRLRLDGATAAPTTTAPAEAETEPEGADRAG